MFLFKKTNALIGIDEVGRGCLAGPVCSAAVFFKSGYTGINLKDSKELKPIDREFLDKEIRENSFVGVGEASAAEIDEINILQATFVSMKRAVENLEKILVLKPAELFKNLLFVVDGRDSIPDFGMRKQKSFIGGDKIIAQISAASIVAKVYRDQLMKDLDAEFPKYGFCSHKGYGTKKHIQVLSKFGPIRQHRKSFAPIRQIEIS